MPASIICWFRYVETLRDDADAEAELKTSDWKMAAVRPIPSATRRGMLTVDVVDGVAKLDVGCLCRLDRWMLNGSGKVVAVFAGSDRVLRGPNIGLLGRYWEGDVKAIDIGEIYRFVVEP